MPSFQHDGLTLFYEDKGAGRPVIFLHEFGGDVRSWADQLHYFCKDAGSARRALALSARGYPPSDVPEQAEQYGWQQNRDDVIALLDHLCIEQADLVGLSMGAYIALITALHYPDRIGSAVCASIGSGAHLPTRQAFIDDALGSADAIQAQNKVPAEQMALAPNRIQLRDKRPRAWDEFVAHLASHPATGAAHTLREVQAKRPALSDFSDLLTACTNPVLILAGDEDEPCLDASLWLKRQMPLSGLKIYPRAGHLLNLEMPDQFNADILEFFTAVEAGQWKPRSATAFKSMFSPVDQ
jgi:pimeloyl-ACP methyl ester carboxylesterase